MTNLNQIKYLKILNIISFINVIIINGLANSLPLNGYQTGEISRIYTNLFTPAPITFSIWLLIYISLIFFIIYQSQGLINNKYSSPKIIEKIGYLFFISSVANIGWLFAWHYLKIRVSFLVMLILLGSLIIIYAKLNTNLETITKKEELFIRLPFSLYTAWITVATFANLTVLLVEINWYYELILAQLWTIGLILAAVFIAIYNYRKYQDICFNLVFIWALLGIIIKRIFIAEELVLGVILTAGIGILIIIGNIIYSKVKKIKAKI